MLLIFSSILIVLSIFQIISIKNYSWGDLSFSLCYLVIPLFSMAYGKELARLFPRAMTILWFLNIAYIAGNSVMKTPIADFGLPGNANWNAALIAVTTAWGFYLISGADWKGMSGRAYFLFICGMLAIAGLWCFHKCGSRAALLSLCAAGILLFYLEYGYRHRKKCLLLLLAGISAIAVMISIPGGNRILTERIAEDVRLPLWSVCTDLIKDKWMTGTTPALFECEFAPYLSEEYFMRDNSAARCNHPHNHLLFFAASYGILLFLLWGFLLAWPLVEFIKNYRWKSVRDKLIFYSFLVLLMHSMLDLVLYEWPTNIIGLALLGVLWGMAFKPEHKTKSPGWTRLAGAVAGTVLIPILLLQLWNNFYSTASFRSGQIFSEKLNKPELAAQCFDTALETDPSPQILYKAAMNAFHKLNKPETALRYLQMIPEMTPAKSYAHSNGYIGLILCQQKKFREGLKYLDREAKNYPLSTAIAYYKVTAYKMLGEKAEEEKAYLEMLRTLELKGLSLNDLPELLINPEYDMHPQRLMKKRAEQNRNEHRR